MDSVTKVALAIVTLGLVATLVVNGANTAKVVTSATSGFSNSLSAAEKG
jgi:PRD1 phage membrane DNA delivery